MHDSRSYRDNAAHCLLAAQEACQPHFRKLRLSMAISWLSLARQDEAMDNLLASQDTAQPEALVGSNPTASAFVDAGMVLDPPLEFSALDQDSVSVLALAPSSGRGGADPKLRLNNAKSIDRWDNEGGAPSGGDRSERKRPRDSNLQKKAAAKKSPKKQAQWPGKRASA